MFGYDEFSPAAKDEFVKMMEGAGKLHTARGVMVEDAMIKEGSNISNRNIASSRLAEILGQDNLIAHSQKLCIQNGEEKLHGVVMDQAIGIDINSSNPADQRKISQIEDFSDPEFQRQITTLEVMDILAGQADRNVGNMFYQLSEAIDGKCCITGIQGIDNDVAFGLQTQRAGVTLVDIQDVKMIDAGLSENLMKVNRDVLDYTFGDILTPDAIGALDNRLTQVKDHILTGHVRLMQPDEWTKETAQQLEEGKRRYVTTVKSNVNKIKNRIEKESKTKNLKIKKKIALQKQL